MKRVLIFILIILNFLTLQSCRYAWQLQKKNGKLSFDREFKNEGEHIEFVNRKIFRKTHKSIEYPRYPGVIKVDSSNRGIVFQIDSIRIDYYGDRKLIGLISQGLVTPGMLDCLGNDSTGIQIHELTYLRKKNKRRFDFWIWDDNMMNPRTILIEITMKNSNKDSSIEEFIKNSRVTFFHRGGIIL